MLDWRVPGYRRLRELRAGTVLAGHEASGHLVLLRYHPPASEASVAARRAEAQALAGVSSPHVASLYEHIELALPPQAPGEVGAVGAVTVREYVAGASMRSLSRSPLPPESALRLLHTGLLALRSAHERGVTHRGYKPENLLVAADGTARLADFAMPASEPSQQSRIVEDVRAAFAVFVAGLGTTAEKLPRRLRPLAAVGETGDGAALLDAVERTGQAGWGPEWRTRGERDLARRVGRVRKHEAGA